MWENTYISGLDFIFWKNCFKIDIGWLQVMFLQTHIFLWLELFLRKVTHCGVKCNLRTCKKISYYNPCVFKIIIDWRDNKTFLYKLLSMSTYKYVRLHHKLNLMVCYLAIFASFSVYINRLEIGCSNKMHWNSQCES